MRNKIHVTDNKMQVTRIDDPHWLGEEAKRMSSELLRKEHRGPGDTIEAAANRLQTKHRVEASILIQGWQRPAREMKVSRWMSVFKAYWAEFGAQQAASYEEKRNGTSAHPALVGLADFIAGRPAQRDEQ